MSVTSQIPRKVSTAAPGATLFPYDFKVLSKFDMEVQVDGVVKTVDVDYTLTGVGLDAGGDITFLTPMVGGESVLRRRAMSYERANDFQQLGDLRSQTLNNDQDAPVMMIQQLAEVLARCLQLPADSTSSAQLPAIQALRPLLGNAAGTGFEFGDTTLTGDMLLRPNLASEDPTYGAALVKLRAADPLSEALTLSRALQNAVCVTWYASDAQLAIDATAATQKAIAWAISTGIKHVHFPGGRDYRFAAASASVDPGVGDMVFSGDGWGSRLIFEEGTATGSILDRKNLFRNTTDTAKGSLRFQGLHFHGTWAEASYPSGGGGATMLLDYYDEIVIESCKFTNLRSYVMANEFIRNVRVSGCTFDKCARDMCRFRSSFNVQVLGNRFSHCDDDAVALHSNINVNGGDIREGIVVADNVFEDCPAIQIIGGRMVTVRGNMLRRCKQNGILVYTATGVASEGDNAMFSVDVSNNQIYDMLADSPFSAAVTQVIGVYSRAAKAGSSTSSIVPGANNTSTGAFVLPWNNRNTAYSVTADSVAPPYFVRVQNNTIARTLPAVAAYTTWGYGSAYASDGPQDPAVTDAALRPGAGILLGGQLRKAIVSGNVISHVASCISFDQEAGSNLGLDDVLVTDNVMFDFNSNGINIPNPGSVRYINLDVRDNLFDGDPYHVSTNRKTSGTTDGTWLADGAPQVISCVSHNGVRLEQNKIRNVCRVVNNSGGSVIAVRDNVLRCDPSATGFSTSNKGIGNCPRADDAYRYEIMDSDPTSATYGQMSQSLLPYSAAQPASGKYVAGTFIRASSGTTLLGWQRLTTGSAHVAGTDWKAVALT